MANRARHALKRKLNLKKGSTKWNQIQDERAVKRPLTPYIQFSVDRHASGDFRNIGIGERAKLIGQEWKALSESEKKVRFAATTQVRPIDVSVTNISI